MNALSRCFKSRFLLLTSLSMLLLANTAHANIIDWVDWTASNSTSATGSAPINGVNVGFTGGGILTGGVWDGTNIWSENPGTFVSLPQVSNYPGINDVIFLTGGPSTGLQTLTFSQPVTNPVMGILSLGSTGYNTSFNFDTPFDVLTYGPSRWGNGFIEELPGNVLNGQEGNGLIQFQGTVSSISWTNPTYEYYYGFNIGVDAVASNNSVVPEPMTMALLGSGLVGMLGLRRKRA